MFDVFSRGRGSGEGDSPDAAVDGAESDSAATESTRPGDLSPADFRERAEALAGRSDVPELDFSEEALPDLDSMATGTHPVDDEITYGSYLGETLVREYDGEWVREDGWRVAVALGDDETTVAVFDAARMGLEQGPVFAQVADRLHAQGDPYAEGTGGDGTGDRTGDDGTGDGSTVESSPDERTTTEDADAAVSGDGATASEEDAIAASGDGESGEDGDVTAANEAVTTEDATAADDPIAADEPTDGEVIDGSEGPETAAADAAPSADVTEPDNSMPPADTTAGVDADPATDVTEASVETDDSAPEEGDTGEAGTGVDHETGTSVGIGSGTTIEADGETSVGADSATDDGSAGEEVTTRPSSGEDSPMADRIGESVDGEFDVSDSHEVTDGVTAEPDDGASADEDAMLDEGGEAGEDGEGADTGGVEGAYGVGEDDDADATDEVDVADDGDITDDAEDVDEADDLETGPEPPETASGQSSVVDARSSELGVGPDGPTEADFARDPFDRPSSAADGVETTDDSDVIGGASDDGRAREAVDGDEPAVGASDGGATGSTERDDVQPEADTAPGPDDPAPEVVPTIDEPEPVGSGDAEPAGAGAEVAGDGTAVDAADGSATESPAESASATDEPESAILVENEGDVADEGIDIVDDTANEASAGDPTESTDGAASMVDASDDGEATAVGATDGPDDPANTGPDVGSVTPSADAPSRSDYEPAAISLKNAWPDYDLDFSPRSLARLDRFLDEKWAGRFRPGSLDDSDVDPDAGGPLVEVGAYVGEVLIQHYDAQWVVGTDDEPALSIPGRHGRTETFPVFDVARTSLTANARVAYAVDAVANRLDLSTRASGAEETAFALGDGGPGTAASSADVITTILDRAEAFVDAWPGYDLNYRPASLVRLDNLAKHELDREAFRAARLGDRTDPDALRLADRAAGASAYFAAVLVRHLDAQWEIGDEVALSVEGPAGETRVVPFEGSVDCLRGEDLFMKRYDRVHDAVIEDSRSTG